MTARILVTGAAGYIGSHTAIQLLEAGHHVVGLDRRTPVPGRLPDSIEMLLADVADVDRVERALSEDRIDAVIHLAGDKSVAESMANPSRYFENNVLGTIRLAEAMRRAGTQLLVFSSSAAVYGEAQELPISESHRLRPESPYGESKLLAERALHWFEVCHGIRSLSLRYFNAAGAALDGSNGEDWEGAVNLVPLVIEAGLRRGAPLRIFGSDYPTTDGTAIRDYVHVLDLATAHLAAVEHLANGGQTGVLNVGTGQGTSVSEVVEAVERVIGQQVPVRWSARRPGDSPMVWADTRLATEQLGWEARFGLDEIVESAVRWHRSRVPLTAPRGPSDSI
jgi:UDP-glucose-4-epimerase GalE